MERISVETIIGDPYLMQEGPVQVQNSAGNTATYSRGQWMSIHTKGTTVYDRGDRDDNVVYKVGNGIQANGQ